jgi:hypothetical protein
MYWRTMLIDGRSTAGGSEVAGRPEHAFPVALADVGPLLAQQATGNTLEAVRVRADVGEDAAQDVDSLCVEHTVALLCDEDPMHV